MKSEQGRKRTERPLSTDWSFPADSYPTRRKKKIVAEAAGSAHFGTDGITRRRIVCAWARVGCVLWDNFPDGAGAGLLVPEPKVPEGVLGLLI